MVLIIQFLNIEKINLVVLAVIQLRFSEGIVSQSISQFIEQKIPLNRKSLKFRSNLLEAF